MSRYAWAKVVQLKQGIGVASEHLATELWARRARTRTSVRNARSVNMHGEGSYTGYNANLVRHMDITAHVDSLDDEGKIPIKEVEYRTAVRSSPPDVFHLFVERYCVFKNEEC